MVKKTRTRIYDTETATLIKKATRGFYGDPKGYEMAIYLTENGDYFLYTYGGEESPYPTEKISMFTKAKAIEWIKEN